MYKTCLQHKQVVVAECQLCQSKQPFCEQTKRSFCRKTDKHRIGQNVLKTVLDINGSSNVFQLEIKTSTRDPYWARQNPPTYKIPEYVVFIKTFCIHSKQQKVPHACLLSTEYIKYLLLRHNIGNLANRSNFRLVCWRYCAQLLQ